jgi:hypothetical protein
MMMDTILFAVTAISLAMAAGMGAMLIRTLRLERRRSDARVELLEELAAERPQPRVAPASRPQPRAAWSQKERARTETRGERVPVRARSFDDFELRPNAAGPVAGPEISPEIFEEHEEPSAWPRRFAVIGVMAAVMFAAVFGWRTWGSADSVSPAPSQSARLTPTNAQTLELLSLQHAQQDGTLVISGLVQNPRGSEPLAGVQATVVLFDAGGATLATSRAPIDFTTLSPGDESSFVIRIPAAGAVARYRVGFRGGDDRVLGHVDRRNNETVARKQTP